MPDYVCPVTPKNQEKTVSDTSPSTRVLIDLAFTAMDMYREYRVRNRECWLPPEFVRAAEGFADALRREVNEAVQEPSPSEERGRILVALARAGAPRDAGMDYDELDNARGINVEVWPMDLSRRLYRVHLGARQFLCHYVAALSHWNIEPFKAS